MLTKYFYLQFQYIYAINIAWWLLSVSCLRFSRLLEYSLAMGLSIFVSFLYWDVIN